MGLHYRTNCPVQVDVIGGIIRKVTRSERRGRDSLPIIAPALVDIQINGYGGVDFTHDDLSQIDWRELIGKLRAEGTCFFCPTIITSSAQSIERQLADFARLQVKEHKGAIVGVHLEGPFISPEDGPRGAHPKEHVALPDWDLFCRWQDAAEGLVRIVTLAPELPGAISFIERAVDSGVVVGIGHTAAGRDDIRRAIEAGASLSTHLGNGCHASLPRHDNYIWRQLCADALSASLIADGHHLPADVLECFVRCKEPQRCILVSDSVCLAGLAPGQYDLWGSQVELTPAGKLVLMGTEYLAGSAALLKDCVFHMAQSTHLSLSEALDMASLHPAALLGMSSAFGLEEGRSANLLLLGESENGLSVEEVVFVGSRPLSGPGLPDCPTP